MNERKVVAIAVGSAALMLTIAFLPVALLGSSFAPVVALVLWAFVGIAYGFQRLRLPASDRLFERTLEGTLFCGGAGVFGALAADEALQGEWASALFPAACCLFTMWLWGARVRAIRAGRISYDDS